MVNPKKFIDTGVYTLMGDLWPDISIQKIPYLGLIQTLCTEIKLKIAHVQERPVNSTRTWSSSVFTDTPHTM